MPGEISINKYLPIALIYFFFNSIFLPHGLLYTTLLTPFFLIWLYQFKSIKYIFSYFAFTLPFALVHFLNGVDIYFYLQSYLLLLSAFVFSLAFYQFLRLNKSIRSILKTILLVNFGLVILASIAFFIPTLREAFWQVTYVSSGLDKFPRLRLFTYEPSYYSLLLIPIVVYYYLKVLLFKTDNPGLYIFLVSLPLLLSFSLGSLLGLAITFLVLFILNLKIVFTNQKLFGYFILILITGITIFLLLMLFYPDNPLFIRIVNLFEGKDSSFRGRAFESYQIGWEVAHRKSVLFGVGLGQIKVIGSDIWKEFYQTDFAFGEVAIPNATAETLAVFGLVGVFLRITVEVFFFFKTRVYSNYYRLGLFTFIFIYQFTGSFIYNIVEYVIWILAFSNAFREFDRVNVRRELVTPTVKERVE